MSTKQAKLKLKFYQIDVFTETPYEGNPLAIVHLPPKQDIPLDDKQRIAREFNLSETVFLHENDENGDEVKIDIFTPTVELPFAGHPTIGVGWHLLAHLQRDKTAATLLTQAGSIPVVRVPGTIGKVKLEVPINFRVHAPYADPAIKNDQARLTGDDYVNGTDEPHVVASIVKGMTFVLLQLKTTDGLGRLGPYAQETTIPSLGDWGQFIGIYAFVILGEEVKNSGGVNGVIRVQTRMFYETLEDPATGSAACTLAGWLSLARGKGKWAVEVVQGVEMGKKSEIGVVVEVGDDEKIEKIELAGSAVQVMEGHLYL